MASIDPSPRPVSRRRLAFVCPNFHPRTCGVADFSVRLAEELRRRDFEVTVYSRAPAEPHPEAPDLAAIGFPDAGPMSVARHVLAALTRDRPSLVVVHYTPQMWDGWRFGSPAIPWLVRRLRQAGIRVFVLAHELYPLGLRRPDLLVASALLRAQLAAIATQSDRVLVTTETRLRPLTAFCHLLGLPRPGVVRVGANALTSGPSNRRAGAKLGVFSSASAGKGFDVLLDAFAHVARERSDAELVVIGNLGPANSPGVKDVEERLRRHPAADRIRLTGSLTLEAVAREIEALDVYLFTVNTGANTRSSTLPSALGAGIPVVAINGLETDPSIFQDGDSVLFASALTGPAVGAAALRILGDPQLAARLSGGGRRAYERHLSWPRVADQLLRHLGEIP